jgi:hypothetical protein
VGSWDRTATVAATAKKSPAISGGKRGDPTSTGESFYCTPLDSVDPAVAETANVKKPYTVLETFVEGNYDLEAGYILVIGDDEYKIHSIESLDWKETAYMRLIVYNIKGEA